jgi:dephospho-CoA kinase
MIINHQLLQNFYPLTAEKRLHEIPSPIVAITGGIASGKSTVVEELQRLGQHIISADKLIKEIYTKIEAKEFIKLHKSQAINNQEINFKILREETFNDLKFKEILEKFLYSKLPEIFWSNYKKFNSPKFFFYEVPLLFEKKLNPLVDLIVLVHSDPKEQLRRIELRDQSTLETNQKILKSQLPYEAKKEFAHYIIENNTNLDHLKLEVGELQTQLEKLFK